MSTPEWLTVGAEAAWIDIESNTARCGPLTVKHIGERDIVTIGPAGIERRFNVDTLTEHVGAGSWRREASYLVARDDPGYLAARRRAASRRAIASAVKALEAWQRNLDAPPDDLLDTLNIATAHVRAITTARIN